MSDPYWVKSGGLGAPYYNTAPPAHQQSHQMPQHQQQQQQQQIVQPQFQTMSWNQEPPNPMDSWGSWHQQQQPPPSANSTSQNYQQFNYSQHHPVPAQSADSWNWGAEDSTQGPVQQQQILNNNIDQSFQTDSSWNWGVDQSAAPQSSANFYQMGYGGQHALTDQNLTGQNQIPPNNNISYSEAHVEQIMSQNRQSNVNQIGENLKMAAAEELRTEEPTEAPDRYEDQLEPAISETSKNSMTPQWSIESQVSQDSDDISSSLGQTTSQAKSEDSGQRPHGYGSSDAQNLWEDLEDEEVNEQNSYVEQTQEFNTLVPTQNEVDRHNKLNLDDTITALENMTVSPQNTDGPVPDSASSLLPPPRAPSDPSASPAVSYGPPPSLPITTGGPAPSLPRISGGLPPSILPTSGGPPSGVPLSSGGPPIGSSPGGNPYQNRSGLNHKIASKLFSSSGMSRQLFASPPQSISGVETSQSSQETAQSNQTGTVENRSHEPPAGQETGASSDSGGVQIAPSWIQQDNHEVATRFGLDRNQYLETGQLTSQTSEEENAPPPGLHRLVTGQLTEQDSQVSTPPPGLDRMIPGQINERDGMRMVPGRRTADDDYDDDDDDDENDGDLLGASRNTTRIASRDQNVEHSSNLRRMIPGQTDSQEEEDELPNISIGPSDLPPGLHRMVPGESSSPESQANSTVGIQNSQMNSAFQPIEPREPRVVTGVSMESMPQPVVTPSPQQSVKIEPASSSPDEPHENRAAGNVQPPSERSETIGSDGVDEKATDNSGKKSDRRSKDDGDSESRDRDAVVMEPRGRDSYRRDHDDARDRSMSPSESGSNRYRDRRYESAEGRSRYRGDRDRERRGREKDIDYDSDRRFDSRRDHRSKRDVSGDKEGRRRGYNREDDEVDSDEYVSDRDERKWNRDRDADRDRNREGDRDRDRERYRERDRDRYRAGDRSYGDDYDTRERRVREETDKSRRSGGRRADDYHRSYDDDYYGDRRSSRPSSRSGSVHEYGHGYERDYRNDRHDRSDRHNKHNPYYPGGYYYNPQEYYRYQMYYANLRKTDPEAYAVWYRKYYSQYATSQPGTYEDRGSVHSGRSSANGELINQRFERHRSPNRAQSFYQKSPQTSSLNRYLSSDNPSPFSRESGRGVGRGESSLDETNSSIQRLTPFKFSTAHVKGILTRRGHLLKVLPHYPLDGQSATVEVLSLQSLVPQDSSLQELLALPGPLVKGVTHKKTIILYLRSRMESTRNDPAIYDRQSVILLYELLILLLRQNGMIVGTDIAELLLRNGESSDADDSWSTDHRAQSTPSPAPSVGSRTSSASATHPVQAMNLSINHQSKLSDAEITNKFREFLLYGNTKEALEWAMKHGLWGHALFLSSKLDQRMYHSVMTRFANGLTLTDPIQTLYQLLSGWQPAAVTCVADDKWGDWRPHLAMILSNTSSRPEIDHKAIMTLGDTLGARGCLHAAHFCYLMAQHPFGTYSQRSSKFVLLGSSHLRPFSEFACNEAIMITCIYEYARSLADPNFHIPNLQPYKYLMATRLVEANLLPEAVHYCEVVSRLIVQNPQQYDPGFIHDVTELGESLKYHDPFYSAGGDLSAQGDPDWLVQIHSVSSDSSVLAGRSYSNFGNYNESYTNMSNNTIQGDSVHDQATMNLHSMDSTLYGQEKHHQQVLMEEQLELQQQREEQHLQSQSQPQQDQYQHQSYGYQDEQQQWSLHEGQHQHMADTSSYGTDGYQQVESDQSVWWNSQQQQQQQPLLQQQQQQQQQQDEMSRITTNTVGPVMSGQMNLEPMQEHQVQPPKPMPVPSAASNQPNTIASTASSVSTKAVNRQPAAASNTQSNSSWFGGLWNKLALRPKNQMKLPDDKNPSIVWDEQKKRWVNTDGDAEDESANLAPPPKMSEMPGRFTSPSLASSTPNASSFTPVVANGSAGVPLSSPTSSIVPPASDGETSAPKPSSGPNMFKMSRGRSLRASYVDVMNPNGTKTSGPGSLPPPSLFPTSASQPSSLNYFVPAAVEGNENAPTDFLTPAPALPADATSEQQPLSRWSSTSSLSREVQSYTNRRPPSRNQVQTGPAGPQMFNPAQFSQQPLSTAPRKRYAN